MEGPIESVKIDEIHRKHGINTLKLSDGTCLYLPHSMLSICPWHTGDPISQEDFNTWMGNNSYSFALEKAFLLVSLKSRTEKELTDNLRSSHYPEKIIARVMAELLDCGYLNDKQYADQYASSRMNRGYGPYRIRTDLTRKGIDRETIASTLSEQDSEDLLSAAIQSARKIARGKDLSDFGDRNKIKAGLVRRGFGYSVANMAIQALQDE